MFNVLLGRLSSKFQYWNVAVRESGLIGFLCAEPSPLYLYADDITGPMNRNGSGKFILMQGTLPLTSCLGETPYGVKHSDN